MEKMMAREGKFFDFLNEILPENVTHDYFYGVSLYGTRLLDPTNFYLYEKKEVVRHRLFGRLKSTGKYEKTKIAEITKFPGCRARQHRNKFERDKSCMELDPIDISYMDLFNKLKIEFEKRFGMKATILSQNKP